MNESILTWANLATLIRWICCTAIFSFAFLDSNPIANLIGLVTYWGLDLLDGYLARQLNQETRFGAQFDIMVDRILVVLFYVNYLHLNSDQFVPVLLFLMNFIGLDHFLSVQMLRWPIRSPNYFFWVDDLVWVLNWSKAGKFFNTALFTLALLVTNSTLFCSVLAASILAVKFWSIGLLLKIPAPENDWKPIPENQRVSRFSISSKERFAVSGTKK